MLSWLGLKRDLTVGIFGKVKKWMTKNCMEKTVIKNLKKLELEKLELL